MLEKILGVAKIGVVGLGLIAAGCGKNNPMSNEDTKPAFRATMYDVHGYTTEVKYGL